MKLFYFLFAAVALADDACETSTCGVCKNMTGCDWYGFDCLNSTSTIVSQLKIPATATCERCQAGSCDDCLAQSECSWYASSVPGIPGRCAVENSTFPTYTVVDKCPTCFNYVSCETCGAKEQTEGCGWYVLPGKVGGKCREASPAFTYTKVPKDSCSGNRCAGIRSCIDCQSTNSTTAANASSCVWYKSKQPSFYDAKCDDSSQNPVESKFYEAATTCPACAGTSCVDCKNEKNCKWVAAQIVGLGSAFGECLVSSASNPTGKSEVTTCPAQCDIHSCTACTKSSGCAWFSSTSTIDGVCDVATSKTHPFQTAVTSSSGTCEECAADRCYECNNLNNCGWYVEKKLGITLRQGCFSRTNPPAGRELRPNSDSSCDGVANGSVQMAAPAALLFVLAFFA